MGEGGQIKENFAHDAAREWVKWSVTRGQNTLKVGIAQRDVAKSEKMEHDRKKPVSRLA